MMSKLSTHANKRSNLTPEEAAAQAEKLWKEENYWDWYENLDRPMTGEEADEHEERCKLEMQIEQCMAEEAVKDRLVMGAPMDRAIKSRGFEEETNQSSRGETIASDLQEPEMSDGDLF